MHKFLRSVGFSKITKEELNNIFQKIIERPMLQKVAEQIPGIRVYGISQLLRRTAQSQRFRLRIISAVRIHFTIRFIWRALSH